LEEFNFCHYVVQHSPALGTYHQLPVCYQANVDTEVLNASTLGICQEGWFQAE